jgi:hypothetical protein
LAGWSTREESACNAAAARGDKRKGFTEADHARLPDDAHQQLGGPLVVVWDNLNTHVSAAMGELVAARDWLTVFQLPPYAHELNPVDGVREGWAAWDLTTPGGVWVEVKSAAYVQSWAQKELSRISFSTPRPLAWMRTEAGSPMLPGDMPRSICSHLLADTDKATVNPLDSISGCSSPADGRIGRTHSKPVLNHLEDAGGADRSSRLRGPAPRR